MPYTDIRNRRNSYAYPSVGLERVGGEGNFCQFQPRHFDSTYALDVYHQGLLLGANASDRILGYLSVIFWGFYSGQNGIVREGRALGKVRLACQGGVQNRRDGGIREIRGITSLGIDACADFVKDAVDHISVNNYRAALESLIYLPGLQIAFASKVCAFIDPEKCGVIDSVIAERYPEFNFAVDNNGIVKNTVGNRNNYRSYCEHLQEQAQYINQQKKFMWRDRDGVLRYWRALDVERSMYESEDEN